MDPIRASEPVFHYGLPRLQTIDGHFCLIAYRILKRIVNRAILNLATTKGVKKGPFEFYSALFNVALLFLTASIFAIITGIGYGDVSLFLSSIFAVLGVAFIAQWSILSNITASFLIFFCLPVPSGDRIKVVDKDEDICGEIQEISMFHVLIKHDNGNLITYPNNQILQKAVLKLAKNKPEPSKAKSRIYTRRKK
ncbi:LOW QUALITY PROTEIN: small-conductance mechanosensitive channel [Vibrio sp. JCM 19053]|nr:LOW QUALITY PROTEIN: small-conductance mechanosensitive channel [Vibrio sp. JCM 19053]